MGARATPSPTANALEKIFTVYRELYLNQQQKTLSEAVVNLWSNSKAHADNMTSSRYGEIGVGLARGIDKDGFDCWYCVQVFLLDGCEVTWVDTPASK